MDSNDGVHAGCLYVGHLAFYLKNTCSNFQVKISKIPKTYLHANQLQKDLVIGPGVDFPVTDLIFVVFDRESGRSEIACGDIVAGLDKVAAMPRV